MGQAGVGTVCTLRKHQPIWTRNGWAGVKRIIIVLVSGGVGRFFFFVIVAVKPSSQRVEGRQGEEAGAEEGLDPPGSCFGRIVW